MAHEGARRVANRGGAHRALQHGGEEGAEELVRDGPQLLFALLRKELKALQIDRTSCQTFSANQLRVLLTAAAYVLMQELRLRAADTACARAQVPWLRDRLLKLGVQVVCSVRRIVLRLPRATPDLAAWHDPHDRSRSTTERLRRRLVR